MADLEKAAGAATSSEGGAGDAAAAGGDFVGSAARRWRAQDLLDRCGSALRAGGWALSLLAFLIMACNEHGDWMQFDRYEEYRYIVAIGLLTFVYTTLQLVRLAVRLTGGQDLELRTGLLVDFAGDQVGDRLPPHVGAVRRDSDHQPHAPRRGQRVHRLVGGIHQHGLPRLRLPCHLRSHLRLQAGQADLHLRTSAGGRSIGTLVCLVPMFVYSLSCVTYHWLSISA